MVLNWSTGDVEAWVERELPSNCYFIQTLCKEHKLTGRCLLALNERDFWTPPISALHLGDRKLFYLACRNLQRNNQHLLAELGLDGGGGLCGQRPVARSLLPLADTNGGDHHHQHALYNSQRSSISYDGNYDSAPLPLPSPTVSDDGAFSSANRFGTVTGGLQRQQQQSPAKLPAEKTKAFLSFCYVVAVTWITAFVMVIVHDRVPDMKKYPPLPDIFLDNVPHIPWAFDMCEVTGTLLFTMWLIVLLFHKHRFILLRRFFALSGTVFLLRCITMLITSLSVPGAHLQCRPRTTSYIKATAAAGSGFSVHLFGDLAEKLSQAYFIWRGAGMSIQGVRTCGDYMFSGHTVALTMLNFFITEYTPRHIYYVHTVTWMMNMFGIFFILAAHEHYSIDVFVAFYITSRLFLYYHTLSNNQALMQRDSNRTKVWFPLFSYFESSVDGIVPNEYETPGQIVGSLMRCVRESSAELREAIVYTRYRSRRGSAIKKHQ